MNEEAGSEAEADVREAERYWHRMQTDRTRRRLWPSSGHDEPEE